MDNKIYIDTVDKFPQHNYLLKLLIHIEYQVQGYNKVQILNNSLKVSNRQNTNNANILRGLFFV